MTIQQAGVSIDFAMRTIKNPYDKSIIGFQYSCSVFIIHFIRLKGRLMKFKIRVEGAYGCAGFRGELRIHIISYMMCVVVTNGMIAKVANIPATFSRYL